MTRERIVLGMRDGIVAEAGLIAHGRGEAFDYLMGERTLPEALVSEQVALAKMVCSDRSVISVNGNTVVLAAPQLVELAKLTNSMLEVNLFHRSDERIGRIIHVLEKEGAVDVLGKEPDARIPGLESDRGKCCSQGIGEAEVILVPLEDGDRAQALKDMGKFVICIDLNPLSRTSRTSDISIVDELSRALDNMIAFRKETLDLEAENEQLMAKAMAKPGNREKMKERVHFMDLSKEFDNRENLRKIISRIGTGLLEHHR